MKRASEEKATVDLSASEKTLLLTNKGPTPVPFELTVTGRITKVPDAASVTGGKILRGTIIAGGGEKPKYTGQIESIKPRSGASFENVEVAEGTSRARSLLRGEVPEGGDGRGSDGTTPPKDRKNTSMIPAKVMGYDTGNVALAGAVGTSLLFAAYQAMQGGSEE